MTARDDARDVGLLLRYALTPGAYPARLDQYGALLDRYQIDPELRALEDEVLEALGLRPLASDRSTGLTLAAEPDSPLAVTDTSHWLRIHSGAEDRLIYGMALAGIAAWCYPTARSVREPGTRRVTAPDVDRLVRDNAATLEARREEADSRLSDACLVYTRRQAVRMSEKTGRLSPWCTVRMCEAALVMLGSFQLLVPDTTAPPPRPDLRVWRSTDRLRAHVAASGGPLIRQTLAGRSSSVPAVADDIPDGDGRTDESRRAEGNGDD